ncbi:MAG: hypothetical protein IKT39_02525 [Clostridia bacterium]|nr:hypothetical protein [Clostridia bacterium]
MKYKIEIWQHHHITATFESEDISEVLNWYKANWWWIYEMGDCSFTIYKGDAELTFEEENKLGFHG